MQPGWQRPCSHLQLPGEAMPLPMCLRSPSQPCHLPVASLGAELSATRSMLVYSSSSQSWKYAVAAVLTRTSSSSSSSSHSPSAKQQQLLKCGCSAAETVTLAARRKVQESTALNRGLGPVLSSVKEGQDRAHPTHIKSWSMGLPPTTLQHIRVQQNMWTSKNVGSEYAMAPLPSSHAQQQQS